MFRLLTMLAVAVVALVACTGDSTPTQAPADTPNPNYTPLRDPTLSSVPPSAPVPAVAEAEAPDRGGIGVSRASVIRPLEKLGWEFESSPLHDGTPRYMGSPPDDGDLLVDLIGPSGNLTKATVIWGGNKPMTPLYFAGYLALITPDWLTEGAEWIQANAMRSVSEEVVTRHGSVTIRLAAIGELGC